jgi:hypothetical protein
MKNFRDDGILWDYVMEFVNTYEPFIIRKLYEFGYVVDDSVGKDDLKQLCYLYAYEFIKELFEKDNLDLLKTNKFRTVFIRHLQFKKGIDNRKQGITKRLFKSYDISQLFKSPYSAISTFDVNLKIDETLKFFCLFVLTEGQAKVFWHLFRFCDNYCCDGSIHEVSRILGKRYNSILTVRKNGIERIMKYMKKYGIIDEFKDAPYDNYISFLYSLPILTNNLGVIYHDKRETLPMLQQKGAV